MIGKTIGKIIAVFTFLALFVAISTVAHADNITVIHQAKDTGTTSFNTFGACPSLTSGDDCGENDAIVRTNDIVAYLWGVSTGSITETNVTLTGTIQPGMTWQNPIPAPCTGAGSGISVDGLTIICVVPQITPDTSMDILPVAKVDYDSEDGEIITAELAVSSDLCPEENAEDIDVTVSASPQLDLEKKNPGNGGIHDNPITGESGIVYYYPVSVLMANGGKGSEIVTETLTFTDDLSGYPAGSQLYNWNGKDCGYNDQYYSHNGIPEGMLSATRPEESVTNSGSWMCIDNGGSISVTITGADLTGQHTPTEDRGGTVLAADKAYVVAGIIPIWIPIEAIRDAGGLTVKNVLTDFDPDSISGASNFQDGEEPIENNDYSHFIPAGNGNFQKYFQKANGSLPDGQTQWKSGDGIVGPGQDFRARIYFRNSAILPWENFIYCDKIDLSRYYLRPNGSGDATSFSVHNNPNIPLTEGVDFVVEYGSVPNQATSDCADSTSVGGWHLSTSAYLTANPAATLQDDINAVRVRFLNDVQPQQKFSLFTNLTARIDVPNGDILPNYAVYQTDTLNNGDWRITNFDPIEYTTIGLGDRLTMSRGSVRITKDSNPIGIDSIAAGDDISYKLRWTATSETSADILDVIITDTLPIELTYTGATPTPTIVTINPDGTTTLVWQLGDVSANTSGDVFIEAVSDAGIPNLRDKTNKVVISSPTDASPEEFRADEYTIKILNFAAMQTRKTTSTPLIGINEPFQYTINYRNVGQQYFPTVDVIDVFPYVGDGRTPPTSFNGTYTLTSAIPSSTGTMYYSNAASGSINADPAASSNTLSAGSIWCELSDLGIVAGCPATNLSDVTAIRFVDEVLFPAFDRRRQITLGFISNNNLSGDIYMNGFSARAEGLTLPVRSNQVPVRVSASAYLDIAKVSDVPADSCIDADSDITYTIVLTNIGRGAACLSDFVDTIPSNSTFVSGSLLVDGVSQFDPTGSDITFPLTGSGAVCSNGTSGFDVGESMTVQFTVKPDPNHLGNIINQASVEGIRDINGNTYPDVPDSFFSIDPITLDDDTTVCTAPVAPDINVIKNNDANQDGVFTDSEWYTSTLPVNVTYDILIENNSASDMTIINIGDDTHPIGACGALLNTVVSGNSFVSCQFVIPYTEDNQSVVNIFSVAGENESGVDSDSDPSTVTIPDLPSSIEVNKVANKTTILENGENVEFTVTITNTSIGDTVVITEVMDSMFGDISTACMPSIPALIEPNEAVTCVFTEMISGNAGHIHTNTVTAKGNDDDGNPVENEGSETVVVEDQPSSIEVTKLADPIRVSEPGGDVTFTVQVRNLSAADTVTVTSVVDSVFGDVSADCSPTIPTILAPDETIMCSFMRFVGDNAFDVHTNTITAAGIDDDGNDLSDTDDAQVDVDNAPSAIQTTKVASPTAILENGDDIQFIVTVENISTIDPVTITVVTDTVFGDISPHCAPAIPAMLMPSEVVTCTFTETITGNAGDQHLNTITAEGYDDDGDKPSDNDDATVDILDVPSSMEVTKLANPPQVFEMGADVTFTVQIRNTSPSDTITVTTVTDSVFGDISPHCEPTIPAVLAPDETISCVFIEEITGNAGHVHTNTVMATAIDDDGNTLDDDDNAIVEVLDVPSAIKVTKTAAPDTLLEPRGDVTFTVTVENISLVDTVKITNVVDTVFGDISTSCGNLPIGLSPTEVLTCTFTEELIGQAWDVHTNTVRAEGSDDDGVSVSDNDNENVVFENVPSSINVTKMASPSSVSEPGGDVDFTVIVQNTSLVDTVTITSVVDNVFGDISTACEGLPVDLSPTEVLTCTFTEHIIGEAFFVHTNTVTAGGIDDDGESVENSDSATVDVTNLPPSIDVIKTANKTSVNESGENVTFTVTIENTSVEDDVTIEMVTDDVFGDITSSCASAIPATIVPSESIACTFVEFIEGDIEMFHQNTVTVEGTSDDGESVNDSDDSIVTYDDETPVLNVRKVASVQSIPEPEGVVSYTVTVENLSAADTITVTTLTDDRFGDISGNCAPVIPAVIVPMEMITCVFTETIVGNALDVHTNTVTASGVDDDNTSVEDDDSEHVKFTDVPSDIRVVKTADPVVVMELGGDVTFTVDVINTSLVDTVTITQVIDSVFGDISNHCPPLPQSLIPNESITCQFVEFIDGNAGYQHTNIVTVTGYDNDGAEPMDSDDANVDVLNVPSSMQVTKIADPIAIYELSDTVTFTIEVLNTSSVDTITVTQLTDSVFDVSTDCANVMGATLNPDDSVMCVFTRTIEGNAGHIHTNTVSAGAVDDDGDILEEDDDARVDVLNVLSNISIIKSASTGAILEPGAAVTFTFTINNLSSLDVITITEVMDNVFGDVAYGCEYPIPHSLMPLETMTCTVVEHIAGNAGDLHKNTVTVRGTDDDGDSISDNDNEDVSIENVPSSMNVTKVASPTSIYEQYDMGEDVMFTVSIQNTSFVAMDTITVTQVVDNIFGDVSNECNTDVPVRLPVGEFITCTFTRTISGNSGDQHHNTVTVNATDDDGDQIEYDDDAIVDILDVASSIETTKTAEPSMILEPGANVTFTIVTVNTSMSDPVTVTQVIDSVFGNMSDSCFPALPVQLAPNENVTCSFIEFVAGNANDLHENTVTVSAIDDDGNNLKDSDTEEVTVGNVGAAIKVTKLADPVLVSEPEGDVQFTVIVENDSSVDPVTINTVTDNIFGDISASCTVTLPYTLQVGESFFCAFTETITGNAGNQHLNIVTANGVSDDGELVGDNDDAMVDVIDVPSIINVTKQASPNTVPEPGAAVTFTISVYNGSPVDTVVITSVIDTMFGDIGANCEVLLPYTMAVGESFICTFTEFVDANAGDIHENTVTVYGMDDDGVLLVDEDNEFVTTEDIESEIRITKTSDPILIPEPSADVLFTVLVENLSQSDSVTIETIVDDVFGDISTDCTVTLPYTLAVGEMFTCTFSEIIEGNAGDQHINIVTVDGTDDDGNKLSDSDNAVVDIHNIESEIVVVKQSNKSIIDEPGEDVRFTIVVKNTSDADSVTITEVVDNMFGDVSSFCEYTLPYTLVLEEEMMCVFTQFVAANTGDIHTNIVTANGVDDDGENLSASDNEVINTQNLPSSISVLKIADQTTILESGGNVTFTISIENTSDADDVTINNVTDSVFGDVTDSCGLMPRTLIPAESIICSFTKFIAGNAGDIHTNTISVIGIDDDGVSVVGSDDESIIIEGIPSSISVLKTASTAIVNEPGNTVTFTVTIENTSLVDDVTIHTVTDSVFGDVTDQCGIMPRTLTPNDVMNCVFSDYVSGNAGFVHKNTVLVSGVDDDDTIVESSDNEYVFVDDVHSSIEVTKSASVLIIESPEANVTFTVTVRNSSSVDSITVNEVLDSVFGDVTASCGLMPRTLDPAESMTCTFSEIVSGNGGEIHTNTVVVSALDDDGIVIVGDDDAVIEIVSPTTPTPTPTNISISITPTPHTPIPTPTPTNISTSITPTPHTPIPTPTPTSISISITPTPHTPIPTPTPTSISISITPTPPPTIELFGDIEVLKSTDNSTVFEPGADVNFTVFIENTSMIDVTVNEILDSVFGDVANGCGVIPRLLSPGETMLCEFTGRVEGNAGHLHTNTVTVNGIDSGGNILSGQSDESVLIQGVPSSINVSKSTSVEIINGASENVVFEVLVENTSLVDSVTIEQVIDSVFGNVTNSCGMMPRTLSPAETLTCIFSGQVERNTENTHNNVVTVTGYDDDDAPIHGSDEKNILFADILPSILVNKSTNVNQVGHSGDDVVFTIIVTNESDFEFVIITDIEDNVYGRVCDNDLPLMISPNGEYSCTFTAFVGGRETHINTVSVTGMDYIGRSTYGQDSAIVSVATPPPSTVILPGTGSIGDAVYHDQNNNDIQDEGEGIPDVTIIIEDGNGNLLSTTTDENGSYLFMGLSTGTYTVTVDSSTLPDIKEGANIIDLYSNDNVENGTSYVELGTGQNILNVDFSIYGKPTGITSYWNAQPISNANQLVLAVTLTLLSITTLLSLNLIRRERM